MNKIVVSSLSFIFGVGIGGLIGIIATKRKFEEVADAEIASVKKLYEKHFNGPKLSDFSKENKDPENNKIIEKPPVLNGRVDYTKQYAGSTVIPGDKPIDLKTDNGEIKNVKKEEPHFLIVSPEFFRESEYECVTLTYYADKILADEDLNVIHTPKELIGDEALNSFGRYEDDCVYVRDNKLHIDYEIILDPRKYADVISNNPENQPNYP